MKKSGKIGAAVAAAGLALGGFLFLIFHNSGGTLDVVGKDAQRALAEVRAVAGQEIVLDGAAFRESGGYYWMEIDPSPFLAAGLRGADGLAFQFMIKNNNRLALGYHAAMDHYNITFGGGNLFEWAKDLRTNGTTGGPQDKDIVFVLNPEPLIAAGLDPENVEGWAYAPVQVEIGGRPATVWKLLKPFDFA
ncbi:MAG: hypothetical protein LBJ11_08855 [Oscillospiraceae bacterium]|jgi:hypothetical protein|nr:hypothetical protein [Oscillospiraceae bacterium]